MVDRSSGRVSRHHHPLTGHGFIHADVDDYSRLAYAEIHPDETRQTAAEFLTRGPPPDTQRLSTRSQLGTRHVCTRPTGAVHSTEGSVDPVQQASRIHPRPLDLPELDLLLLRPGGYAMGTVQVRSLGQPDETRSFPNGAVEMVTIARHDARPARFEPGWRWSNDVKPVAGSDWCMVLHEGYCGSGSAIVLSEDGSETRIGPGDGCVVQPGHDAWVIGDEPWVTVDSSQAMADYAKPGGAA